MTPSGLRIDTLATLLDAAQLRHQVIAQNVANVNTPGYRRLELDFESQLQKALNGQGLAALHPRLVEGPGGPVRADGNNVDIGLEMGRLDRNALVYQTFAQILTVRLAAQRSAITGR
jgi:flagellar basal-body rod protein FlgB